MPTPMLPAHARVINPVLSNVARGYKHPEAVGMNLFPFVPVGQRGGKVISFSPDDFKMYDTFRVAGQNTKRVQFGYSGADFVLEQHALEGVVPIENEQDARAVPGIRLGSNAVQMVQNIIGLRLEKAQADLATTAGNYGSGNKLTSLSGSTLFSDLANSNPVGAIEAGKEAVRGKVGRRPNVAIMGPLVYAALKQHSQIIERNVDANGNKLRTVDTTTIAKIFEIPNIFVGDMIYQDASGAFVDVWGKSIVLAFVDVTPLAAMGSPSYGYTYRLNNYPLVEEPYYERNPKSWIYPVTDEVRPVIAGADAGYLISPAVA